MRSLRQLCQYALRRWFWRARVAWSAQVHATALIDRTYPAGVVIGQRAWIGPYVVLLTHDMTRGLYLTTTVADNAVIGARAVLLPGVTVGAGAMVAPGSVVAADVAPGERVAGNPARRERAGAD